MQNPVVNLAAFAAALLSAVLLAFVFWVGGCRRGDGKEPGHWPDYVPHPLYFVSVSFVFAALFVHLGARYGVMELVPLGAHVSAFATAASIHYAARRCGDAETLNA
jgi:hypothetical protein